MTSEILLNLIELFSLTPYALVLAAAAKQVTSFYNYKTRSFKYYS